MTSHHTKVKVKLSMYVNVSTDSHPEDIAQEIMKDIILDQTKDLLLELSEDSDSLGIALDNYEFDDVKMFDNP